MTTKLDTQTIKNLKKPGRYTDALAMGLHLWVKDGDKKYWIYRYTIGGKQKNIGLGPSAMTAIDLDFNPSMQQLGQNVLPVFDSLVFF